MAVTSVRNMNDVDIENDSDAVRVYKAPVEVKFEFAAQDGTVQTKEGPVRYMHGDAIMTGVEGERWPIRRPVFDETYDITEEGIAVKKRIVVLALQLKEPFSVSVSWSKDRITGKPNDWLIQSGKRKWIVDDNVFKATYLPE